MESPSRPERGPDVHSDSYCARNRTEDLEESLRPIRGAVLVDADIDVVESEDGGDLVHCTEQIGYDIRRIVKVDCKEVLVVLVSATMLENFGGGRGPSF